MNIPFTIEDITSLLSLERSITQIGAQHGHDGDPFTDPLPHPKTTGDLYAAWDLFHSLPGRLKNLDRELALKMCRAVVWGSSRAIHQPSQIAQTIEVATSADAKLARERRRAS